MSQQPKFCQWFYNSIMKDRVMQASTGGFLLMVVACPWNGESYLGFTVWMIGVCLSWGSIPFSARRVINSIRDAKRFKEERAHVDFWLNLAQEAVITRAQLEENGTWAEKQQAEAVMDNAIHRMHREVDPILAKWK